MPVLSLPEFLGLQEAPQAPVFQRTNQLRRPTDWERFAQTADAVTALRQQRPMAQIQAIQNEYDTIRDNADKLRREREAAMQAEQAVSALAGLNEESPDYLQRKRQIQQQWPYAQLDPRVASILDDKDRMFNTRQSAMARMEEERLQAENRRAQEEADRRAELASLGVFDPNERARLAKSSELTGEEKFRRSQKPEGVTKDKALDTIINQAFAEFDAQYMPPEGMSDPTEIAIDKSAKKYALNQRLLERFGAVKPQVTQPTTAVEPAEAAPVIPKASFQETMKAGAKPPSAVDILKIDDKEILKDLSDPSADENTFMFALQDPATSEQVKREALNRLKAFAKEPKFPKGTGPAEARAKIAVLKNKVAEGERELRKLPEQKKINEAWTAEKSDMDRYITEYAKSLGLDPDIVAVGIAQKEPLEKGFNEKGQRDTYRDDFARFLSKKMGIKGDPLSKQSDRLFPFQGSEFAEDFGLSGNIPGFRSIGKGKTYGEVLDTVLAEKFGGNTPEVAKPVATGIKPSNIKSITPID